jgi:hypothetical protein
MASWSGFWDVVYTDGPYRGIDSNNIRRAFGRAMHGYGNLVYNRTIRQLVAGNVGGTAAGGYTRITAPAGDLLTSLGGVRTVENRLVINRVTTAADQAKIDKDLVYNLRPTWTADKSGNGGGGKGGL